MRNFDKVRGILSALNGTQIPKFLNPSGNIDLILSYAFSEINGKYYINGKEVTLNIYNQLKDKQNPGLKGTIGITTPVVSSVTVEEAKPIKTVNTIGNNLYNASNINSNQSTQKSVDFELPEDSAFGTDLLDASRKEVILLNTNPNDLILKVGETPVNPSITRTKEIREIDAAAGFSKLNGDTNNSKESLTNTQINGKITGVANTVGTVADTARLLLFSKLRASNSSLTLGLNTAYDAASSAVMAFAPVGTVIGGAMKVGAFIGDGLSAAGLGTDLITTVDKILDSNFFKLTPVGLINATGAKKTLDFSIDQDVMANVGSSYGGSVNYLNKQELKAGKKYGLFSRGNMHKTNTAINKARTLQGIMRNISEEAENLRAMINDLNYANYAMKLNGGYNLRLIRAAKHGSKLLDKIDFIKLKKSNFNSIINLNSKEIEWQPTIIDEVNLFKLGGNFQEWKPTIIEVEEFRNEEDLIEEWKPIITDYIEEFKDGGKYDKKPKNRTIEELIEYAKTQNPRFILRMSEPVRDLDLGNGQRGTHLMSWGTDDDGNAIVYSEIQENNNGDLFNYGDAAIERALKNKNYLLMTPEEAKLFTESGIDENGNLFGYKKGWPEFFKQNFKEGGSIKESEELIKLEETTLKNIIPDGALHKNKHHMEHAEGLTLKGVPVIDNEGNQLAEVEREEIIFTLEVTKALEERYHKYYSDELTLREKDELAIEAGKILVKEILYNTDDRVGLIDKCKEGGKL